MVKFRVIAALLLAALVALGPIAAEARAGGHFSFSGGSYLSQGSRGLRTFDSPMQNTLAQRPGAFGGAPRGYGAYHPFWTGLAGAFFGSWLGSMLFPHWGYGNGFGHAIGSIFSLLIILWLGRMAFRLFAGRPVSALVGGGALYGGLGGAAAAPVRARGAPLAIAGADYSAFEAILKRVQEAWSAGDLAAMRAVMTPEMVSYFAETLAQNRSNGVENHVERVELLRGDLREAWDEGRVHYATCYLRWRALDYTLRLGRRPDEADAIIEGDPRQPAEAAETWTFARSPGGQWLLSAIQQA